MRPSRTGATGRGWQEPAPFQYVRHLNIERRLVYLVALMAIGQGLDLFTFYACVIRYGISGESNPFVVAMFSGAGPLPVSLVKVAVVSWTLSVIARSRPVAGVRLALVVAVAGMFGAFLNVYALAGGAV